MNESRFALKAVLFLQSGGSVFVRVLVLQCLRVSNVVVYKRSDYIDIIYIVRFMAMSFVSVP